VTSLFDDELVTQLDRAFERPAPPTAALEAAFGEYFAPWGIALPHASVVDRLDGSLLARGR
jgi:hypothetical protein